jgi:hypothetical protein
MGAVVIWRQLPLQRGRGVACERPDVLIAVLAALVIASMLDHSPYFGDASHSTLAPTAGKRLRTSATN